MADHALLEKQTDTVSAVKDAGKNTHSAKRNVADPGKFLSPSSPRYAASKGFNAIPLFSNSSHYLQTKLSVNQPGDKFEQEADAMAERVLKMDTRSVASPQTINTIPLAVQRKCSHCEDEEKKKQLQRKESNADHPQVNDRMTGYLDGLHNSGAPFPQQARNYFEPRFGYDFSKVRIHTDTAAAQSARSINALAYTTSNNIVFNSGQYDPRTNAGKKLLGHELTHVIQQRQGKTIQRAPAPPKVANWWDDKSIGMAPLKKFWDDIHLFFPKDGRKFSGTSKGNVTDIDTDDTNVAIVGKAYWDEADPMKRKAMLVPLIEKVDNNRYKQARIDNEDLTNDKITAKLKALAGTEQQSYLKKLTDMGKFVKNDQVIAYINGDDKGKTEIVRSANETLLDWKFDQNRLTDADLNDPKTNTRLRGLSTADKLKKETDTKDLSAKTGEKTGKLQEFLHAQTQTSTPVPDKAVVDSAGGFKMSFPNVDVIVLPDTSGGSGNATSFKTNLPTSSFQFSLDASGLITGFFTVSGKTQTPLTMPSKLVITIQTSFQNMGSVDSPSAYGKGTTAQDIKWGGTTLRFHEGSHGKGFIDFIASHNFPSIALGTVKAADFTTINGFMKAMNVDSCTNVDQVGTSQDAFIATPAGRASGIVSCR
jgi:hypothetical protein